MKNLFKILLDQMHTEGAAGGGGGTNVMDGQQAATATPATVEAVGTEPETDDFGYPITKTIAATPPNTQGTQAPAAESKQAAAGTEAPASATGYEEDIVIPPPAEPALKAPEAAGPTTEKLGYELDLKDVDKATADKLTDFAKANGLSKEAAQAFVELKKGEISAAAASELAKKTEFDKSIVQLKSDWQKNLKSDPVFGGENYSQNIKNVSKLISEFMPGINKTLTEGKRMLPPEVMKDFAALAKHLYAPERIVQGNAPAKADEASDDPLDYYI